MKPRLLLVVLTFGLSCQKDINRVERLYGKWVLTGGTALQKRQALIKNQPPYLVFDPAGSIQSNGWGNCSSFQTKRQNELSVINNCVDCIVVGCGLEIWHYQFTAPDELTIEFQPADIGFFKKQ